MNNKSRLYKLFLILLPLGTEKSKDFYVNRKRNSFLQDKNIKRNIRVVASYIDWQSEVL